MASMSLKSSRGIEVGPIWPAVQQRGMRCPPASRQHVEHLNVAVILAFALFEDVLRGFFALGFVGLRPFCRQRVEAGMAAENPRVLIEHVPEQNRQPGYQSDGQPEARKKPPEQ